MTATVVNDDEIPEMIRWAHGEGMDLTLIETMPLGDIPHKSCGPARYVEVKQTGGRLGFSPPHQ